MEETNTNETTPQEPDRISLANAAAERLEQAAARMEKATKQAEALRVNEALGGRTQQREAKKEETPAEYANRLLRGELREEELVKG